MLTDHIDHLLFLRLVRQGHSFLGALTHIKGFVRQLVWLGGWSVGGSVGNDSHSAYTDILGLVWNRLFAVPAELGLWRARKVFTNS